MPLRTNQTIGRTQGLSPRPLSQTHCGMAAIHIERLAMKIIRFNDDFIAAGRAVYKAYLAAAVCGADADCYEAGMARRSDVALIAGAIVASLEYGLNTEDAIVLSVARATRCKRSTVWTMLQNLTGTDPVSHLFMIHEGRYRLMNRAPAVKHLRMLLAA
jgi:hypothetical protein